MISYRHDAKPLARLSAEEIQTIVQQVTATVLAQIENRIAVRERPQQPPKDASCPRVEAIIAATCELTGIARDDFLGPRRARHLARPRQVAMLACANLAHHASLPQIGRAFGGRDHTTVIHGVRKAAELLDTKPDLRALYDAIVAKVTEAA